MDIRRMIKQSGQISPAVFLALWLIGCAVGPDFRVPDSPAVERYTSSPMSEKTVSSDTEGGGAQTFVFRQDIPRKWWTLFQSESLNELIHTALQDHPSVGLAKARLREARESRAAQFGTFFPSVDASAAASRQKLSGASLGQPDLVFDSFSLFNASIGVSYTLDIFGGMRRQLEALDAEVDVQKYQLEGAYLILTSNIVTAAMLEASLRRQLRALEEIVDLEKEQLHLVEKRYDAGAVSLPDVLAQRAQLAQSQAAMPLMKKNLSIVRHQLAILVGKLPAEVKLPQFEFDSISLPLELPVSMPSSLVRQRPDIKAAEAVLHKASAEIGVATANLYPKITLTGSYGFSSNDFGTLLDSRSMIWNFGAGILQPLFHGGSLLARRRAAMAVYDQAREQYRLTVMQSFQNVADVLRALEADAQSLQAQVVAEEAARKSLELTRKQYESGAVSYLLLLNAQRQYQDAYIILVQARATRFTDTASLFAALGGGWWNDGVEHKETSGVSQEKYP